MNWVTVISHQGSEYYRTWFLEECLENGIYGITESHIISVKDSIRNKIPFYLEDVPYFRATHRTEHLVYGPLKIVPSIIPAAGTSVFEFEGRTFIYKAHRPQDGPWLDRRVTRKWDGGLRYQVNQKASDYGFYPFRFSFKPETGCGYRKIKHESHCFLCK